MTRSIARNTVIAGLLLLAANGWASDMASIPGGVYEPFYPVKGEESLQLEPFEIDATQVTNGQYLEFVEANPEWRRSAVPEVFADGDYLQHWAGDLDLGAADPGAPVVNVSWFAANAYCEAQGKRLPDEAEWEFTAWANEGLTDARREPGREASLLLAYNSRGTTPGPVAAGSPNAWGVHDLHSLVWEWVSDFGGVLNKGDSRNDGDRDLQLYCGGASLGAADRSAYATFMRFAFRSSLEASATAGSLGFRCAR